MIYDYCCGSCGMSCDIVKRVVELDRLELCTRCNHPMVRVFHLPQLMRTKVEDAYFCNGLGRVVKNSTEAKRVAKERGLVEVGNEKPEKYLKVERKPYD